MSRSGVVDEIILGLFGGYGVIDALIGLQLEEDHTGIMTSGNWTDGTMFAFQKWTDEEPNNLTGDEFCVTVCFYLPYLLVYLFHSIMFISTIMKDIPPPCVEVSFQTNSSRFKHRVGGGGYVKHSPVARFGFHLLARLYSFQPLSSPEYLQIFETFLQNYKNLC